MAASDESDVAIAMLRDRERRDEALTRLVKLGDARATPALIECLTVVLREIQQGDYE